MPALNEDPRLMALLDKTMGLGRSPQALANPPALRGAAPIGPAPPALAINPQPAPRGGRGFASPLAPTSAVPEYIPGPGASRGVPPMRNPAYQLPAAPPRLQAMPSVTNRTLGRPADSGGISLVQNANAASRTAAKTPATVVTNPLNGSIDTAIPSGTAAALPSQAPLMARPATSPALGSGKIVQEGNSFSQVGSGTVTLADARALPDMGKRGGGLSVIGMGLSPEATVAKLKDQTEQVRQLNRMKATGLSETELAKVDARRAKDSEIFQLTQGGHSLQNASSFVANRDAALVQQTAESPTQIAAGQQALAAGNQGLQKGAAELQKGQEERSMLTELQNLDPNKPESKALGESIIQRILLGRGDYKQPEAQKSLGYGALTDPITGETKTYSKDTGGINAPAAQAAPPPDHIAMLQGDPSKEAQAEFEAIYGPGSAAQYLK